MKPIDWLIRVAFRKILTILLQRCGSDLGVKLRRNKDKVLQHFYKEYGSGSPASLKSDLKDLEYPSLRRLKRLFVNYSLLALDFEVVLKSDRFYSLFRSERRSKAVRYCFNMLLKMQPVPGLPADSFMSRKRKYKTFPLSETDFTMACQRILEVLAHSKS